MDKNEGYERALIVVASQTAMVHYGAMLDKTGDHESSRKQAIYWVAMVVAALNGVPSGGRLPLELQRDCETIVDNAIASLYPSRSGNQN